MRSQSTRMITLQKNRVKREFNIVLKIDGEEIWCKKIREANYEKLVTSKGYTLFLTSSSYGNPWSTTNDPAMTDQLTKDSRLILLVSSLYKQRELENCESVLQFSLKLQSKFIELQTEIPYEMIDFDSLQIHMVLEGSCVKIMEKDGLESWKICKFNDMFKSMFLQRGNRYFIA